MTDYKKSTGSSGTMMIRDNGTTISFLITSGNSSTFNHDMPWGYTINGSTNNDRSYDYGAGDGWVTLGTWTVTTDQTVTFRLFDTGTSGLGGPTTFSVNIDRTSVPGPATITSIGSITGSSVIVYVAPGANNGANIDGWQIAHNTSNTTSGATIQSAGNNTLVSGLAQGKLYYFWARNHNAKGWGPWSAVKTATTLRAPDAPNQVIASDASQVSVIVSFTDGASNGGSTVTERRVLYNTVNSTSGGTYVTYTGVMTITGLLPGTTYYLWGQTKNAAGWSAYSAGISIRTVAGARVNVNGVTKEAIPYINVGGTWKIAQPWGRVAGVWKKST